MLKLVVIGTIAALGFAQQHPVNHDIVAEIKAKASTWVPMDVHQNPLKDKTVLEIKGLFGTVVQGPVGLPGPAPSNADLPTTFDARKEWPECIHPIRDQARCGSCWAFGASEALSDRFCVASKGEINVVLSPQDMVSCDGWNLGCNGGILPWAWSYLTKTGIVSDDCLPYSSADGSVAKCPKKCENGGDFKKYKCKAGSVVEAKGVNQIKQELVNNGPLETGFTVYEDFMSYRSGVYQHVTGDQLGGHAVKIIGWGDGYWICANSWSEGWGEKGYFNIKFGDSGIDRAAYGCTPAL